MTVYAYRVTSTSVADCIKRFVYNVKCCVFLPAIFYMYIQIDCTVVLFAVCNLADAVLKSFSTLNTDVKAFIEAVVPTLASVNRLMMSADMKVGAKESGSGNDTLPDGDGMHISSALENNSV